MNKEMRCPREGALELAAGRLIDAGLGPAPAVDLTGGEGVPPDLAIPPDLVAILDHARNCVRCRELLDLFHGIETHMRNEYHLSDTIVLALRPVPAGPPLDLSATPDDEIGEELYEIAADSASDARRRHEEVLDSVPVLTIATEDGRFFVRIFPNESGKGATAVLQGDPQQLCGGPAEPARRRLVLRVGGVDYPFNEDQVAALPDLPSCDVALVLI